MEGLGEEEAYPSLVQIGKSIVHKCRGVPLAAKTLGSALRHVRDDNAWKNIEGSALWKIEQGPNDILPALKLSYDQTPYHIRPFFLSCALLRKSCSFFRFDLINMWVALGLLQSTEGGEDVEVIGNRYFDELLYRSFVQLPSYAMEREFLTKYAQVTDVRSPWEGLTHMFKNNLIDDIDLDAQLNCDVDEKVLIEMHDLLHDLATYVSRNEIAVIDSQTQANSASARHILWDHEDLSTNGFPVHHSHSSKARLFMFVHPMGSVSKSFLKGLLSNFKCLRILNLDFSEFEELPSSVGDLKHLRCLSLCWNSKLIMLPRSTCKLVNLQSLYLFRCSRFRALPKDIHKLVSLRFLDLTLSSKVSSNWQFRSLRFMRLWLSPYLTSLPKEIGSLRNLRRFEILGCASIATLPNEMIHLTNLETIKICYCRSLDLKGWEGLYGLRSLRCLVFKGLAKLTDFPEGFDSIAGSLQHFRISHCEGLRALPEGWQHCTSLSSLTLSSCPNLTDIPRGIHALKSLQQLNIMGCPEITRRCKKDTGSDWHLISHIPIIRIDLQVIQSRTPQTQQI